MSWSIWLKNTGESITVRVINPLYVSAMVSLTCPAGAWQEDPQASPEDFQLAASGHSNRSQGADRARRDLWHNRPGHHRQSGQTQSKRGLQHQHKVYLRQKKKPNYRSNICMFLNVCSMFQLSGLPSWPIRQSMVHRHWPTRLGRPEDRLKAVVGCVLWLTATQPRLAGMTSRADRSTTSPWAVGSTGQWRRSWKGGADWLGLTSPTENWENLTPTQIQSLEKQQRQMSMNGNK